MIVYPNIKINLGLNVVRKREDGYHDLESIFYPIPFCDILEILPAKELSFKNTGISIDAPMDKNLVVQAFNILKRDFNIPPVVIHLHKQIPFGAGLGGGSADAAFALKLMNELFKLNLSDEQLEAYALELGSDCPFFIKNEASYTWGRGENLESCSLDLNGWYFVLLNPEIHVSTAEAYAGLTPKPPTIHVKEIISNDISTWKDSLHNDFENSIFSLHPEIKAIKDEMYQMGAVYASMSGSGSSVFAFFKEKPQIDNVKLKKFLVWEGPLE